MVSTLASILKSKESGRIITSTPNSSVTDAVRIMAHENVGAVVVMRGQDLVGIFTERDLLLRVVAQGRDPNNTQIAEVMTTKVNIVDPTWSIDRAMRLVADEQHRHLPVVKDGKLIGMVSVRDITNWIIKTQQEQFDGAINAVKQFAMSNRRPAA